MDPSLAELVKKKQTQSAGEGGIDWAGRRDTYLAAVGDLYRRVEAAFQEAIVGGVVRVHRLPRAITESYIGTYTAEDLVLEVAGEPVRFKPRGRNIAGAAGRVDVVGERGEAMIVLRPDTGWEIVEARHPKLRTTPFDESALAGLLREVMGD